MHVSSRLVSCEGRQIGGGGGGLSLSLARQRKMRFRPAKGAKNPRRVEESNRSSRAFNGMHHLGLPPPNPLAAKRGKRERERGD